MIQLVIIEDDTLLRLGIKTAINIEPDMEVIGEAGSGLEGLKIVEQAKPDIVLVDISLPDTSGLEITYKIKKQTNSKVVILTGQAKEEVVELALSYGADSFLLKKNAPTLIKQAIISTYHGHCLIDPSIAKQVIDNHQFRKDRTVKKGKKYNEPLTNCETEVLRLIASGFSNEEIGQRMFITLSTVKSHANNILIKLNARNRSHAITKAIQLGYLNSLEIKLASEEFSTAG